MKEIKIKVVNNNWIKSIRVDNEIFIKEFINLVEKSLIATDLDGNISEITIDEENNIIVYGIDNNFYKEFIKLIRYYVKLDWYNYITNRNNKVIEIHYDIDKKVTIRL